MEQSLCKLLSQKCCKHVIFFKILIEVWSWFILNCNNISNYSHMYQEDGRNVKPVFRSEVLIVEASSILFIVHHYCRFRTFSFLPIKFPPTLRSKCVLVTKARQRSCAWALLVEKHQQNQKLYSFFSSLRHIEYDKVDVMCLVHSYNMDDR